jgi:hypothetical protein
MLYGLRESPEKVTLIERPVWRVIDSDDEVIAICMTEEDAAMVAAALNDFSLED